VSETTLSETELGELAYLNWTQRMPATASWNDLDASSQQRWINRVGGYLSLPWEATPTENLWDRCTREACQERGGVE
jgi:hypothetical protein